MFGCHGQFLEAGHLYGAGAGDGYHQVVSREVNGLVFPMTDYYQYRRGDPRQVGRQAELLVFADDVGKLLAGQGLEILEKPGEELIWNSCRIFHVDARPPLTVFEWSDRDGKQEFYNGG